jgi:hypothetical protein
MVRVLATGQIRPRFVPAEGRMPFFAVLLSTAVACGAILMPASGVAQEPAALRASAPSKFEHTAWDLIRDSDDPADFETYLEIYPNGRFKLTAKQRINELTEQRRKSRAIVLAPASRAASEAAQPQLPATRSAKSGFAFNRPPPPPRKKPNFIPAPAAYVPVLAVPQPKLPATKPTEPKPVADVESRPVTEPEPIDPLNCAMGGMDSE